MPVFFPGNVQEVLDLGLHAIACSRASGLWVGFKIVTNVADARRHRRRGADRVDPGHADREWEGRPYEHEPNGNLLAPASLELERTLLGPRTELALAYARANGSTASRAPATPGSASSPPARPTTTSRRRCATSASTTPRSSAPASASSSSACSGRSSREIVREFAAGLDEILVVEEKGPFLETLAQGGALRHGGRAAHRRQARRAGRAAAAAGARPRRRRDRPRRRRAARAPRAARSTRSRRACASSTAIHGRRPELPLARARRSSARAARTTRRLKAPDGTLVGVGIGCHTMVLLNPEGKGEITGITQMGGEGAQWIGLAPFTDDRHLVQNLGDGTFHHSGSLAIRAAVAAGRQHHLQAALQRARRDDRRPGDRGPADRARADALARARGRQADHRHDRGHEPLQGRRAGRRSPRCATATELLASAAGARRGRGRHRPDPRPGVRGREAPPAQARQGARAGRAHPDQRARLRGLRRLRREVELPVGAAGRDRVRPQDADPPGLLQQGLLVPRGRLPVVPDRRARPRRRGTTTPALARRAARARARVSARTTSACA